MTAAHNARMHRSCSCWRGMAGLSIQSRIAVCAKPSHAVIAGGISSSVVSGLGVAAPAQAD